MIAALAPSVMARALGRDFERLHPMLRRRFGFDSAAGHACVGTGVMDEVWRGPGWTRPFLRLGALRNILLPEAGRGVPFRIENHAFVDGLGRETLSIARSFRFPTRERRFDAWMVWSERRGCIVDYLGTHQHLAVDLHPAVTADGALLLSSGAQRLHEGPLSAPVPPCLVGDATVRESYDEREECFRIEVRVASSRFGPLFGYRGRFTAVWLAAARPPQRVLPRRLEARD